MRLLFASFSLFVTGAAAQTLPLPGNLIDLRSQQGEQFLLESKAHEAFLPISSAFVTQKNQAYCGVASMVMALNAIQAPAPSSPEYEPYHTFTQDNLLDDRTEAILPSAVLARRGTTLDELGQLLSMHPVKVEVHHATADGLDEFRKSASEYLSNEEPFRACELSPQVAGAGSGGSYFPFGSLRREGRPVPNSRRCPLQISARVG